jgi:hypothetical protein
MRVRHHWLLTEDCEILD